MTETSLAAPFTAAPDVLVKASAQVQLSSGVPEHPAPYPICCLGCPRPRAPFNGCHLTSPQDHPSPDPS